MEHQKCRFHSEWSIENLSKEDQHSTVLVLSVSGGHPPWTLDFRNVTSLWFGKVGRASLLFLKGDGPKRYFWTRHKPGIPE